MFGFKYYSFIAHVLFIPLDPGQEDYIILVFCISDVNNRHWHLTHKLMESYFCQKFPRQWVKY